MDSGTTYLATVEVILYQILKFIGTIERLLALCAFLLQKLILDRFSGI